MSSWWVHYSTLFCALVVFTRAVPALVWILTTVGSLFITSHIAVLLAYVVRSRLNARRIDSKDKAVFVTGCDSGFGHQLAKRLDALGFQVFAGCLFPNGDGALSLRESCSNQLEIVRLDVTKDEDVAQAAENISSKLNGKVLWGLVNNAGVGCICEAEWCTMATYRRLFEVNTFGVIRVTQALLPFIRSSKGRIVNVTSGLGRMNCPSVSAYCMSKHAAASFTDCLRVEMRRWGVRVCGIEPWFYKTPMTTVETLLNTAHKNWDGSPDHVKSAYGSRYFERYIKNLRRFLLKESRPHVHEVVDCMEDALTSGDPDEVYTPRGTFELLKLGLAKITPLPALDIFVELDMGYTNMKPAAVITEEKLR